jgi:hypothetical protein
MARASRPVSPTPTPELGAPHREIQATDERERFTLSLLDALWERYRQRVPYVQAYEQVVREAGGTFVNDHIAFRTIACQQPAAGIATVSRLFAALGYRAAGCYHFPDKHLSSLHYQHSNPAFPKLFISELELWELAPADRKAALRTLRTHRALASDGFLASLRSVNDLEQAARERLLRALVRFFHNVPWDPPARRDVLELNEASQFGAWVLVHGYNVNHFTALVNSHGTASLADIEKTADGLRAAGVPMKAEIEGRPGSKLRQTATEAAMLDVAVRERSRETTIPWTYAYFELAERGAVTDPETGRSQRFEGFLGPQATQLFDMTRVK